MIATVIGSTGLTGSALVRKLLADSEITKIISVSRKSLNIAKTKLTEVLISDLAELLSIESRIRAELYFCCLGTTIKTAGSKENFEKVDHTVIIAFAKIESARSKIIRARFRDGRQCKLDILLQPGQGPN